MVFKNDLLLIGFFLYVVSVGLSFLWSEYFVAGQGVVITGFMKQSPAREGGLHTQDVILGLDTNRVNSVKDFLRVLSQKSPGELVLVQTLRGVFPVVLEKEPIYGTARLGVFVKTIEGGQFSSSVTFTVERVVSLAYWLGLIHLVIGVLFLLRRASLTTEFVALNALNVVDIVSTNLFLQNGRVEGNPFGLFLLEHLGFASTAVVKFVIVLGASALFIIVAHHRVWKMRSVAHALIVTHRVPMKASILLYLVAVLINVSVLF